METSPDEAGFDPARLNRIDEHLQANYLDRGRIAGCQLAVVRGGVTAHRANFGSMDRERGRPVADDTIWRWYSMTKPITGIALLTLHERGLFRLDDPVSRFIPAFADTKVGVRDADGRVQLVDQEQPITIRHAMMHLTGIGPGPQGIRLDMANIGRGPRASGLGGDGDLDALMQTLAGEPLRFQPGSQWLYTWSTDVCARLVEVISGQRFDDYLRTTIFEPLGMADTGFFVEERNTDRLAALYARNERKELVLVDDPADSHLLGRSPKLLSGGGGLLGPLDDYVRFATMLANRGELDGTRIVSRKTIELMGSNHLPGGVDLAAYAAPGGYGEVGFDGMGFGLTVAVSQGPVATGTAGSVGEFMWGGAASTIFWVDPTEDLTAVFMTQLLPSGTFDFRGQLKAIIYGALAD